MGHEAAIKYVLYAYEKASYIDYDPDKVLALMSDDVIGIGIGGQDTVSSKKSVKKILQSSIKNDHLTALSINYDDIEIRFRGSTFAILTAKVSLSHIVDEKAVTSSFMQSLSLSLEDGEWLICHFHASPIMLSMENTDASPLLFSGTIVENLRSQITAEAFDLISASFVGGVVGVHKVGNAYPLYFANEGIARFLGYTLEEFHQIFKDDVSPIFYAGDYEHAMKLTEDMIVHNVDVTERLRLQKKDGSLLPVIDYARKTQDSNGRDILIAVFTDITELVELHEKLEAHNATILSSMRYASKIQKNSLPALSRFKQFFSEAHTLWKPKDIVGGDVYWLKEFDQGAVLVVSDCTGHGTPGALITMLVASILDNVVTSDNCRDTAQLMRLLDQKIATVLNVHYSPQKIKKEITHIEDGCDLAVLFIAKDGTVTLSSSGIHVFVCDGQEVRKIKGQQLSVGSGTLKSQKDIRVIDIPANPSNKFYIASDGLYDQIGGETARPFGYQTFKKMILENHTQKLSTVSEKIWDAFEQHRGSHSQRDDVELVSFQP